MRRKHNASKQRDERELQILVLGCPSDAERTRFLSDRLNGETGIVAQHLHASTEAQWKTAIEPLIRDADVVLICVPSALPPLAWTYDDKVFPNHISFLLKAIETASAGKGYFVPVKLSDSYLPYFPYWSAPVVNLYEMRGYASLLRTLEYRTTALGHARDYGSLYGLGVFISYSHRDESLRDRLEQHLSILKRQGHIHAWHDRQIDAGAVFDDEITAQIESAELILLLVSANFLASDYCWGKEMMRALQRHEARQATVIPIIARPCDWERAPFAGLLALPHDGKPISSKSWTTIDEALAQVARGIRSIVESIRGTEAAVDPISMPGVETTFNIAKSFLYPRLFQPDFIRFKQGFYRSDTVESSVYGGSDRSTEILHRSGYTNISGALKKDSNEFREFSILSPMRIASENTFVREHYRIVNIVKEEVGPKRGWRVESFFSNAQECIPTYYRCSTLTSGKQIRRPDKP